MTDLDVNILKREIESNFDVNLLKRKIGSKRIHQSIRPFYGHHRWAKDLDIINELGGHTGCVNALSWAKDGSLLASGSDDTYLNIWSYNPAEQARPFTLNTSVSTGHRANIFSVKFMPHSGDRTVVTCAGDSEVRVFDLEYAASTQTGSEESTRSRRFEDFFAGTRWLTHSNTNGKVYRSHADRAKRIVTESSPYLFLSCSEDGEVRQWDLRQPSSAYPPPRNGRRLGFRRAYVDSEAGDSPPPLISYKAYGLDLNSISCSGSQPQYIALGGAHLHCFLHDRRMLGRNISAETGRPVSRPPVAGTNADEEMREATRCVRRFAPNNKRRMKPGDAGHITACKISDARPNELVSSWSGDHIYTFDIVKSPDARDEDILADKEFHESRMRNFSDRKRKRTKATPSSSRVLDGSSVGRRLRKVSDAVSEHGQTALRVRYENGEVEDIPTNVDDESVTETHDALLSEAQKVSEGIAKALVKLRKTLFDFSAALNSGQLADMEQPKNPSDLTGHTANYDNALGQASQLLSTLEQVMSNWRYPIDPDEDEVDLQNTLRRNRQATWRFVQAAGCLSRALGGSLPQPSNSEETTLDSLKWIRPAPRESATIQDQPRFCYDFLRAIVAWLIGGKTLVLESFKRPAGLRESTQRYPLDDDDSLETFVSKLKDYLLSVAEEDKPIIDVGKNRFERDELREVFPDQRTAVQAFSRALENIELQVRQGTSELVHVKSGNETKRIMDKGAAARFWGEKVGRFLLMTAAEGLNFDFVNRAFGGIELHALEDGDESSTQASTDDNPTSTTADSPQMERITMILGSDDNTEMTSAARVTVEDAEEENAHGDAAEEDDQDEGSNDNDNESSDSENSDDEDEDTAMRHIYRRGGGYGGGLAAERAKVNLEVPYTSHAKIYKGHCNTRTVKDVNYYGLDDEYIVSGSDDGHFFIWDRKTCKVVNILAGDGEVVNVVQGHPYEPMIACSGIDSTIKIFGPGGGSRERANAAKGLQIANPGNARHSSLADGLGRRRRPQAAPDTKMGEPARDEELESLLEKILPEIPETYEYKDPNEEDEEVTRDGLNSRRVPPERFYEIKSQNNMQRRQGTGDGFITQGMIARFIEALNRGDIQVGEGFEEAGGVIVADDNCAIM